MKQKDYQQLESVIREKCKELQKLSFGCLIRLHGKLGCDVVRYISPKGEGMLAQYVEDGEVHLFPRDGSVSKHEIIGHPILLNHVLKALESERELVKQKICIDSKGYLNINDHKHETEYQEEWNLDHPDLESQSDELKALLYKILIT